MHRHTFLLILALSTIPALLPAQTPTGPSLNELTPAATDAVPTTAIRQSCISYNELNSRIRDGKISKEAAQHELKRHLKEISREYYKQGGRDHAQAEWVFPLAGYGAKAIGGGRNHGYLPKGYDFFTGNRHGGHPALDIFISDRNQDSLDDRTGKPVTVLSVTGGVVVALEKDWDKTSKLRGGKYIWIFDPGTNLLLYYAHNNDLMVDLGDIVSPGFPLATVGRSGLNAARRRSPTHLHFSVLKLVDGHPSPQDIYNPLVKSERLPKQ